MIGNDIYDFAQKLWPLNRSVTGEGVRETLVEIKKLSQVLRFSQYHLIQVSLIGLCPKNGL